MPGRLKKLCKPNAADSPCVGFEALAAVVRAALVQQALWDNRERKGTCGDERLSVEGDLSHVHGVGREMSRGHLLIRGDVGPQLGAEMTGGTIEVDGSVGDWAGAEMRGG